MKQKVEELSRKKEKPSARLGSARNKKGKLDFEEDDSPYKGKKYGKVRYIKD